MGKKTMYFDNEELILIIMLVAKLDPNNYPSNRTKAVIYRCKDTVDQMAKEAV